MQEPFYNNGLHFTCRRCSSCCRHDPGFVNLSETDLEHLCQWSGLDREQTIANWCRWVAKGDGDEYLCLKEKANFDCILWENGCSAYNYRPLQCSSYPFWSSLLRDEDWWEANARDCPGVNSGTLHDRAEIEEHLTRRRSQPYIHRKAQK